MGDSISISFTYCTNEDCSKKIACERLKRPNIADSVHTERFEPDADGSCDWFLIRACLQNEASQFRGLGSRRHNLHAQDKRKPRPSPESLGLKVPDLMVKRHIRMGKDINKPDEDTN